MGEMETGKGWFSRGYLPHFDQPGLLQSITFRLADAVPAKAVKQWRLELGLTTETGAGDSRNAELRGRLERYEDHGHGACHLRLKGAAAAVQDALLKAGLADTNRAWPYSSGALRAGSPRSHE